MACCDESDDSDAVQPASRAQASVRRPGLRSGKSAPEPGAVDKLSGIRIDYLHAHKDAILTLHSGGYIYRGVETLLDGPSSSSTGSDSGGDPQWFTTAPVPAARKLLAKLGWQADDVDLWEVNEAFAAVPMAFMHELGLARDRVNVNGGACALGHPIGASGSRIIVTLLHALESRGLKRGVAAICIGGGEGTAIAVERV